MNSNSLKSEDRQLYTSIKYDDCNAVKYLMNESSANPNAKSNKFGSPLHLATLKGNKIIVGLLLKNGSNANNKDPFGNTPVHIAASCQGNEDVLKILLENGGSVHEVNYYGLTPLHHAVKYNNFKSVEYLIEFGADVNVQNYMGESPFHFSIGDEKITKLLVEKANKIDIINVLLDESYEISYSTRTLLKSHINDCIRERLI